MPTMNIGKPGFFDQMTNRLNTEELQRRHGVGGATSNDYGAFALENRNVGLAGQADVMGMYRNQALGQGPSVAGQMWQQQQQRNATDALALAARGRGGNIAGMGQQALASNAYSNMQTNQGMAALRAQEQQAGMAGYAGMANQVSGQGFGYDQLNANTQLQADQNTLGWYGAERGMNMQQDMNDHNKIMGWMDQGREWGQAISGAAGGGMGAGMMSDEQAKENLRPTTLAASRAVGNVTPAEYNYKPGMGPAGQRIGPVAQDLESNPDTASLVQTGPDGLKRVDIGGMAALGLAASAEQEGRLRALEQSVGADPFAESTQYAPDQGVDFGTRVSMARQRGPYGIPQKSTRTINPFDEQRGTSGLGQMLSDERTKENVRGTVSAKRPGRMFHPAPRPRGEGPSSEERAGGIAALRERIRARNDTDPMAPQRVRPYSPEVVDDPDAEAAAAFRNPYNRPWLSGHQPAAPTHTQAGTLARRLSPELEAAIASGRATAAEAERLAASGRGFAPSRRGML